MNPPSTFLVYRATITAIAALLVLLLGLGVAGHGPFGGLWSTTDSVIRFFELRLNATLR